MTLPKKRVWVSSKSIMKQKVTVALKKLNLPILISQKDLKEGYRKCVLKNHPDNNGDEEKMQEINEAYKVLKEYMENYKFSFSNEELARVFPEEDYIARFRF